MKMFSENRLDLSGDVLYRISPYDRVGIWRREETISRIPLYQESVCERAELWSWEVRQLLTNIRERFFYAWCVYFSCEITNIRESASYASSDEGEIPLPCGTQSLPYR
jgi:hypothetical protein